MRLVLLFATGLSGWAVVCSLSAGSVVEAHAPDVAQGRELFLRRCGGCHSLDRDKEGPRLGNVYGRKAGSVAGFDYSAALKGSPIVWDERTLDKWLTDTAALVPGNDMDFRLEKPEERAAVIAFLKSNVGH
ncbi:MAG: c-type cytochrome [Acidobacteriota bacterium]